MFFGREKQQSETYLCSQAITTLINTPTPPSPAAIQVARIDQSPDHSPTPKPCIHPPLILKPMNGKQNSENQGRQQEQMSWFVCSLQWCEDHSYCTGRLKLSDFLVKPMQRVTKYPLLVKAVYNKTLDSEVKERLEKMVSKYHKNNNKQSQAEFLKADIKLYKNCMNH